MPAVTYKDAAGESQTVNGSVGTTVMQTAVAHGIDGIVAECGGNLMCATCHVYVDPAWLDRLPPPNDDEEEMLDETTCPRRTESRLSCQIKITEDLDGLVVGLPEAQI